MNQLFKQLELVSLLEDIRLLNEEMSPEDEVDSKLFISIANKLKRFIISEYKSQERKSFELLLSAATIQGEEECREILGLTDEELGVLDKYDIIPFDVMKVIYNTFLPHKFRGEEDLSEEELLRVCCIYDREPFTFDKVNLADRLRKRRERYTEKDYRTPYQKIRSKKISIDRDENLLDKVKDLPRDDFQSRDFYLNFSAKAKRKRDELDRMKKAFIKNLHKGD